MKPADSGQIAKARAFINKKYPDGDFAQYTDPIEELIKDCAAFAASERQAVIEDCCRAVCHRCRDKSYGPAVKIGNSWEHNSGLSCHAHQIRSME